MSSPLRQRFDDWLFRPKTEHGTVVLTQRRIFMLPTKSGLAMALLLLLMLLGDINYNLSLGYVLTFLLAMMAVMSMLHAYRNLAGLEIRAGRAEPVFAGEYARFMLHFDNKSPLTRFSLVLAGNDAAPFDVPSHEGCDIAYPVKSVTRGRLQAGRLKLYTEFPLGLIHAWCYLHFDADCLIYPRPSGFVPLPPGADDASRNGVSGDEDFAGLRNYVPGDALPRIAWKAYARGHALQVKQFSDRTGDELLLDLDMAPGPGLEDKLAQLTRWVLDAEAQGLNYKLRLPDCELPAGSGERHRDDSLRRIALFGLADS